ncbi:MAG TPA: hypothetical protein VJM46_03370 [Candidatus Saccharimonadales bacterium]|nr:hypothetical protein [Candidatus Saccharimonadales bacterium]
MSEYLRRQGRSLQTPQRVYTHPGTGRRVTLIGMVHVAEPRYFAEVKEAIEKCEANGAVVHNEGSAKRLADESVIGLTPGEAELIQELQRCERLKAQRLPMFGWADQNIAMLPYPDTWQFIDLSRVEIIRMTGTEELLRNTRRMNHMMDWADGDTKTPYACRLSIAVAFRRCASNSPRVQKKLVQPIHRVLIDHRNKVALDAVHASTQDVVLVWGATHLPGMEADLRAHGYVRLEEAWRTAFQLPSVIGSLWGMVRGKPLVASTQ